MSTLPTELVGEFIDAAVRDHVSGEPFPIVWSIIGAALFVAFLHLFSRRRILG